MVGRDLSWSHLERLCRAGRELGFQSHSCPSPQLCSPVPSAVAGPWACSKASPQPSHLLLPWALPPAPQNPQPWAWETTAHKLLGDHHPPTSGSSRSHPSGLRPRPNYTKFISLFWPTAMTTLETHPIPRSAPDLQETKRPTQSHPNLPCDSVRVPG